MSSPTLDELVDALRDEQVEMIDDLAAIDNDSWLTPTRARGWDVRDSIAHLADTDELAIDTMTDGPRALARLRASVATSEDLTLFGVMRGRRMSGPDVLHWWSKTSESERRVLRARPPGERVPWGLGMSPTAFASARLMETWSHSDDVRLALGIRARDSDRLAHVAFLATRALPYAYSVAGRPPPADPLRVELTLPSGAPWTFGPPDAGSSITGTAAEYCRVFIQRVRAENTALVAHGAAALSALSVARAYL